MSTATGTRLTQTVTYDVIHPNAVTYEDMSDFLDGTGFYFFTDLTTRYITGTLLPVAENQRGRAKNIYDVELLVKRDGKLHLVMSKSLFDAFSQDELMAHLSRKATDAAF